MKKRIFTVIASVLTVVMAIAMLVACDKDTLKAADEQGSGQENDNSPTYTREGDTIYFGEYPQTQVSDETLSAALTASAGELPTGENSRNWTSYGYYKYGQVSDYMWYIDLKYNGEKYRGVYFEKYRFWMVSDIEVEAEVENMSDSELGEELDLVYIKGNVYWFKYEPIKWRILEQKEGRVFLICDVAIDSQAYNNVVEYTDEERYNGDDNVPVGTYANNYKYSSIREWLNNSFYNTAFSEKQKQSIALTEIDNSQTSTGYSSENRYVCENTYDKVFLPSRAEVINENYGFNAVGNDDGLRKRAGTDYMKSQRFGTTEGDIRWLLRTPGESIYYPITVVGPSGDISAQEVIDCTVLCVVPALWLTL